MSRAVGKRRAPPVHFHTGQGSSSFTRAAVNVLLLMTTVRVTAWWAHTMDGLEDAAVMRESRPSGEEKGVKRAYAPRSSISGSMSYAHA